MKGTGSVLALFNQGSLERALSEAQLALKNKADDQELRFLLVQLYLLNNQYEKALTHLNLLDMAVAADMQKAFALHCYRQIAMALSSRKLFFNQRKLVEVDVSDVSEAALQRLLHRLTETSDIPDDEEVGALSTRARVTLIDGQVLQGEWLDPDDLLRGFFECISPQGRYRLIPMSLLEKLLFESPDKPLDCLLQRVSVTWRTTGETETLLHLNHYPFAFEGAVNLNATDWDDQTLASGIVGIGQKVFCLDDEIIPVSQITSVEFVC
ncbi:MAG: type VI secretion system accessory protein TagJ [Nitrincola lacisaponensis]|uniref:type VI secretion system accessory protein TagJ n=1 Tax=Nitrincola lacisaponensis TaxID=267850 RepID=UPI00391CA1AE